MAFIAFGAGAAAFIAFIAFIAFMAGNGEDMLKNGKRVTCSTFKISQAALEPKGLRMCVCVHACACDVRM